MASSRRSHRRKQAVRRHQMRLEALEKRYALNAAPVLDPAVNLSLLSVYEDAGVPVGPVGTPVSSLIGNGGDLQNFFDEDGDLPGIAIIELNAGGGTYYYTTDDGNTWVSIDNVSAADPLLLAGNETTRLYLQPAANANGVLDSAVRFHAWAADESLNGTRGRFELTNEVTASFDYAGECATFFEKGGEKFAAVFGYSHTSGGSFGPYTYWYKLQVFSIANDNNPTLVGTQVFELDQDSVITHPNELNSYSDLFVLSDGNHLALSLGQKGEFHFLDVSNQTAPNYKGLMGISEAAFGAAISGDGDRLYMVCDSDKGLPSGWDQVLRVYNVSDPVSPVFMAQSPVSFLGVAGRTQRNLLFSHDEDALFILNGENNAIEIALDSHGLPIGVADLGVALGGWHIHPERDVIYARPSYNYFNSYLYFEFDVSERLKPKLVQARQTPLHSGYYYSEKSGPESLLGGFSFMDGYVVDMQDGLPVAMVGVPQANVLYELQVGSNGSIYWNQDSASYLLMDGSYGQKLAFGVVRAGPNLSQLAASASIDVLAVDDHASIWGDLFGVVAEDQAAAGHLYAADVDGLAATGSFSVSIGPTNGQVFLDPDNGSWEYTPNGDYSGFDEFTVCVTDVLGGKTLQKVALSVVSLNDAPVLEVVGEARLPIITEDTTAPTGRVGVNVSSLVGVVGQPLRFRDAENNEPGLVIVDGNLLGGQLFVTINDGDEWLDVTANIMSGQNVLLAGDGSTRLFFAPAPNFFGEIQDLLTVAAWDGTFGAGSGAVVEDSAIVQSGVSTSSAEISVVVSAVDDVADVFGQTEGICDEDTWVTGAIEASDVDGLTDGEYFEIATLPLHGRAEVDVENGQWAYYPDKDFFGTDFFAIEIIDDLGGKSQQVITITVDPVNDDAVVPAELWEVNLDFEQQGSAGQMLQVANLQTGYVLPAPEVREDGGTNVLVLASRLAESGEAQNFFVLDNVSSQVPSRISLTLDLLVEGATGGAGILLLDVSEVGAAGGDAQSLVLNRNQIDQSYFDGDFGSVIAAPHAHPNAFQFSISGIAGQQKLQLFYDGTVVWREDVSLVEGWQTVFLTATQVSEDIHFEISFGQKGSVYKSAFQGVVQGEQLNNYRPVVGARIADGGANRFLVDNVVYREEAFRTNLSGFEDTPVTGRLVVTDPDGLLDGEYFSISNEPDFGDVVVNAATGDWQYTPFPDWFGVDEFTVGIQDDFGGLTHHSYIVEISQEDDVLAIDNGEFGVGDEDTLISGVLKVVDPDGLSGPEIFSIVRQGGSGSASIDAFSGEWEYSPNENFHGDDSFGVRVVDDQGGVSTVDVHVEVRSVDDSPENLSSSAVEGLEDEAISGVLNVVDPDGIQDAIFALVRPASNGSVVLTGSTWVYTPEPNFFGDDSFMIEFRDDDGWTAEITQNVVLEGVNDEVSVTGGTEGVLGAGRFAIGRLQAHDIDGLGSGSVYRFKSGGEEGDFSVDGRDGLWSYQAGPTFDGSDVVVVEIIDDMGWVFEQAITITGTPSREIGLLVSIVVNGNVGDSTASYEVPVVGVDGAALVGEPVEVTVVTSDPQLVMAPTVVYSEQGAPSFISIVPVSGASGIATISIQVEDGGADNDLATVEDNGRATHQIEVKVLEVISSTSGVVLSKDEANHIYAATQPIMLEQQQAPALIKGFAAIGVEEGNVLLVERGGTTNRLVAEEGWNIRDIFHSLRNNSSAILNPASRDPIEFSLTAIAGAYEIEGIENQTLTVRRGQRVTFDLNVTGHPFYLQTTGGGYVPANVYTEGFSGNGQTSGRYEWVVPEDAPDELFYQCEFHPVMFGKIVVVD